MSLSGNALAGLNGGLIYAPSAALTVSGNGQVLNDSLLIVDELQISGNGRDHWGRGWFLVARTALPSRPRDQTARESRPTNVRAVRHY